MQQIDRNAISLEEFKARLPIAEIVGRYVRLTRRGREFTGLCPFHQEKTPSFTISEEKGFYHCFGCNQHGNAVDFIMAIEGLDFGQAIQRLADITGLPTPMRSGRDTTKAEKTLYQANEAAAAWFQSNLAGKGGDEASHYLERRGLDESVIERFGLGYAPSSRGALRSALMDKGFAEEALVKAGVLIRPDDGNCYDRFRHRVMFPIHDARGRVVAFGGRALGEARAKYLNTPETELFHKGNLLYGLSLARTAARQNGSIIVAEGYMDVIALARAGFDHAVAPLGTAVTETQLDLLWQMVDEPIICLDGDEAGLRAGHRLIERALPKLKPGRSLRFALLTEGSDPDDMLRLGGRDKLSQLLNEAMPLLDFLWQSETRKRSLDTPERQAALRTRLSELSRSIEHPEVRQLFREAFQQQWRKRFGGYGRKSSYPNPAYIAPEAGRGSEKSRLGRWIARDNTVRERELIGPLLTHAEILADVEEELCAITLADSRLEAIRQEIISWYSDGEDLDPEGLSNHLCNVGFATLVNELTAKGPTEISTVWYCRDSVETSEVLTAWRERLVHYLQRRDRQESKDAFGDTIIDADQRDVRVRFMTADIVLNKRNGNGQKGGQ
ncbi:MAG: DNA primase [Pseudomonadota bacterium]